MLKLEGALRDIQDATASLDELSAARAADAHQLAFSRCVGHVRGAQWQIQQAVKTAARQEPGRPRVDAAAAWWAAQAETIDGDPLLTWARDAASGVLEPAIAMRRPPDTHLGALIPAEQQTPAGLLSLCIAHCGDLYDRAMRAWS